MSEHIRSEWRQLGFFCERDDNSKEWRLAGSREGLGRFSQLLLHYIADPRNTMKSEHQHYGPYLYLEIMTWPEAGMDRHAIHGSLEDLGRLAKLVDTRLATLAPGSEARIREAFAPSAEYSLVLDLRSDDFDPASADASLR